MIPRNGVDHFQCIYSKGKKVSFSSIRNPTIVPARAALFSSLPPGFPGLKETASPPTEARVVEAEEATADG
jgi:hypothetical protein